MTIRPLLLQKALSQNSPAPLQSLPAEKAQGLSQNAPGLQNTVGFKAPDIKVPTSDLPNFLTEWMDDGEWRGHSPATLAIHRQIAANLLWYLGQAALPDCGLTELRKFFLYLQNSHAEEGGLWHGQPEPPGRWGNPQQVKKVSSGTVVTYHQRLKTFFAWMVKQGYLAASPMERMSPPIHRRDQTQPLSPVQMQHLAKIARTRVNETGKRDETILWLLFDTGLRRSELCGLKRSDLDMQEKKLTFAGKGGKRRTVYFGKFTTKALWAYLRETPVEERDALFQSEKGRRKGQAMSASALNHLFWRINESAQITGVRVSPHTLRHSFAINYLRGGGSMQTLKEILGHTTLQMTLNYVAIAEADLESQRLFSPADRLNKTSR